MRDALAAAEIGASEVTAFWICGTDDIGVQLLPADADQTFEAQRDEWRRIRDAVLPLGRVPIGTEEYYVDAAQLGGDETAYGRAHWAPNDPSGPGLLPRALIDASFDVAADQTEAEAFERLHPPEQDELWSEERTQRRLEEWAEYTLASELRYTAARVGEAPSADAVKAALGVPRRGVIAGREDTELDRFLFDWEEARAPTIEPEWDEDFHPPYEPWSAVHLLPLPWSWACPAYLAFQGAPNRREAARLIAVLRSWHERHGVEVRSRDSVLLELVVERPPATLDEAYRMAMQLHGAHRTQGPMRAAARALWQRREFTLYQRP